MVIPEEELFVCPISLDLMSDPVTLLGTGHTYDRPTIQRWLAAGHRTCPVTMQPLQQSTLVPNRTLKHLIDRWLLIGNDDVLAVFLSESLAASRSSTTLVETLRIVRSLSPAGFCPLLLQLLLAHAQGCRNDDEESEAQSVLVAELALDCLVGSPSTHELASALHEALQQEEGSSNMSSLVLLLRQGSAKVKTGLCRVMEMVAAAAEGKEELMRMPELVMGVLAGLVRDKGNAAVSDAALRAMSSLCSSDEANRAAAVAAGAVDALVSYISGPAAKTRETGGRLALALRTLELLLSLDAGRQAMYSHPTATAVLVRMVFRAPSDQGGASEHAIGSLLVACRESARVRVDAINAGLLTQLLLLLQSQCCGPKDKAKARARALLKLPCGLRMPPHTE